MGSRLQIAGVVPRPRRRAVRARCGRGHMVPGRPGIDAGPMLLLCSTDTSIAGDAAVRVAADLAERLRAELADARDPTPRLIAAGREAGCDLLVIGYTPRSALRGVRLPGWQQRVVRDAACPVMLVPAGTPQRRGTGVVLGSDVPELPHQAARVAGRLAARLRGPVVITDVLAVGSLRPRQVECEGRLGRQPLHEAALVVIGGRGSGRTLLPHRGIRSPLQSRLPIVVAATN